MENTKAKIKNLQNSMVQRAIIQDAYIVIDAKNYIDLIYKYCFHNNEEEIQHIVPVSKINGDVYQESELNGITTLTFSLSIEDSYLMNDIFYVVHKDVEDRSKFYQYRIIPIFQLHCVHL